MRLLPLREAASAPADPAQGDGPPETTIHEGGDNIEDVPIEPDPDDGGGSGGSGTGPGPSPVATGRARRVPLEPVFTPVFETYGNLSTHSVSLSIRRPDEPRDLVVRVRPVGEDGWLPRLGLMDVSAPARVSPDHRNAFVLPAGSASGPNGRVAVELKFNEPVHNRSFSVTVVSTGQD